MKFYQTLGSFVFMASLNSLFIPQLCYAENTANPGSQEVSQTAEPTQTSDIPAAGPSVRPVLTAGITFGGDTLAERVDGTELTAGGLLYGGLGIEADVSDKFGLQAIFGYHFDYLSASNGSADFSRFYLELVPFIKLGEHARLGIGVQRVLSAEYSDPYDTIEMEDTNGVLVEWSYNVSKDLRWGIRYADIEYTASRLNGFDVSWLNYTIDGSYLGLSVYIRL